MIDEAFFLLLDKKPNEHCDKFMDYVCNNFIDELVANYPPTMWAREVTDSRDIRTTNGPEAFHRVSNSHFVQTKPNIYRVLDVLLLNQEKNYLVFNDLSQHLEKKHANAQARKDEKVREAWSKFKTSQRTDDDLWRYMSYMGNRFKGKKI